MYSIEDMYNPVSLQDIMNPAYMDLTDMYRGTNLLGGTQIKPQPIQDAYETIDKKNNETKNNFKAILKALGLMILGGFIPAAFKYVKKSGGKLCKNISQMFGNLLNKIKGTPNP